jgi:hypothetical protein
MRFNRGTIILLAVCVVIIAAVVVVNNQPGEQDAQTIVDEEGGPVFADLTAEDIDRLTVYQNGTEFYTELTRDTEESTLWAVAGPEDLAERTINQTEAAQAAVDAASLEYESAFEIENLADFGLDAPAQTVEIDTGADTLDIIFVGITNPSNNRFYVMTRQVEAETWTAADNAPDLADGNMVLLVNSVSLDKLTDLVADPPFVPLPTVSPTPTATLNPMSEVEIATATAEFNATATVEMESVLATIAAQDEATAEATAETTAEMTEESG